MSDLSDLFGDVIHSYSRKQAIEAGELIDLTNLAKVRGFKIPVAITKVVWNHLKERGESDERTMRKATELLEQFRSIAAGSDKDTIFFEAIVVRRLELKAMLSAGDNGEPVITIMWKNED